MDTAVNVRKILRPGLPGYADNDVVEMEVIQKAHGISDRTGRNWRKAPDGLPYMPVGKGILVSVGSYRKWLRSQEVVPGAKARKRRAAA